MNFISKNFDGLSTRELYEILKVRSQIFIVEQNMHCQDIDDVDYTARHFGLEKGGKIQAYLRAFYIDDCTVRIGNTRHWSWHTDNAKSDNRYKTKYAVP